MTTILHKYFIDLAKVQGYTKELMLRTRYTEFPILVLENQNLDEQFTAYDVENEEWITVHGYNCTFEEME